MIIHTLCCNIYDTLNRGTIQIIVVLASLYEEMGLYIPLHLFYTRNKMIISGVNLDKFIVVFEIINPRQKRSVQLMPQRELCPLKTMFTSFGRLGLVVCGTQEPNLDGNSLIKSSFSLSLRGPKMITGRVYSRSISWTASYVKTCKLLISSRLLKF